MAIKASASITLSFMVDIKAVYRYYKLQASTASAPSVPTTNPPSGWTDTEPSYTSGSTNTLYTVELTVFTNNTFLYSEVSKSSSYEAAKEAYNKAQNAQNTANNAQSSATNANNKIDNLQIGGRNYILNGSGTEKKGFFKNFNVVDSDGYYMVTLSSRKTYSNISLYGGFVLNVRDYVPGSKVTFSYDIMYTQYDFPEGSDRQELWMGQRYTDPSWLAVTQHSLPAVGSNGCELNEWYHVEKVLTIPAQADDEVGSADNIQFYNSNADVTATVTFKLRNVKLEYGNKATDWTPAPEDTDEKIDNAQNSADNAQNSADNAQNKADEAYDKAEDASKVATNYLDFEDGVGLTVGDMVTGTLGKNVLIDADSVDIRDGNKTLASFGADRIELGKESSNAVISMRNNTAAISTFNRGAKDYTQFVAYGNMDVSGLSNISTENYKRGGVQTTIESEAYTVWKDLEGYTWSGLSNYTWADLHGDAFLEDRSVYFETSLYAENIDGTTSTGYTMSKISLKTKREVVEGNADKLVSEVVVNGDSINLDGATTMTKRAYFDSGFNVNNGICRFRTGDATSTTNMITLGWKDAGASAGIGLTSQNGLTIRMYDDGTYVSNPIAFAQNGNTHIYNMLYAKHEYHALGRYRLNNGWIGFYAASDDAATSTGRLGWMGFDNSTTNFTIKNEGGGYNYINKAWTVSSDRRLKDNIEDIPEVFVDIWKELQPKVFKWNELNYDSEHKYQFGLIAQDVIDAFEKYNLDWRDYNIVTPFKMMDDDTEYFSITYDNYHMLTSLALKDAVKKHDLLQSEIDNLQNQINELKALVESVLNK